MAKIIIDRPNIGGWGEVNTTVEGIAEELFQGVNKAITDLGGVASYVESITVGMELCDGKSSTLFSVTIVIIDDLPGSGPFGERVIDDSKVLGSGEVEDLSQHILDRVRELIGKAKLQHEKSLGKLNELIAELDGDEGPSGILPFEGPVSERA